MQQSALRSLAIVCDHMETTLFAIVCDLRSAICDPRSSAIIWKPAFNGHALWEKSCNFQNVRNGVLGEMGSLHHYSCHYSTLNSNYLGVTAHSEQLEL